MNRISLCLAYYENAGMLAEQMRFLRAMPARAFVELVVVDDGSPTSPALPVFLANRDGIDAKLYRIGVDVAWNQDACRNLAASEATHDWLLLTDMDHVPTTELWMAVLQPALRENIAYQFERVSAPAMTEYKPHPNSYLMHRSLYDRIGGYDERYAGLYGTDGNFLRGAQSVARFQRLPYPLIRYPREVIPDASTTTLERKKPGETERVKAMRDAIAKLPKGEQRPVRGRFPWERVA